MEKGITTPEELRKMKKFFLKLLKSSDKEIVEHSIYIVPNLISRGIIISGDVREAIPDRSDLLLGILDLLDNEINEGVWFNLLSDLLAQRVLIAQDISERMKKEVEIENWKEVLQSWSKDLSTPEEWLQWLKFIHLLLKYEVIPSDEFEIFKRQTILDKLKYTDNSDDDEKIQFWKIVLYMLETEMTECNEITSYDLSVFLVDVLSIKNERRVEAWDIAIELISFGLLTYDDIIIPAKLNFLELLYDGDTTKRLKCWHLASYLISKSVIMPKDIKEMKEGLFGLLKSHDHDNKSIWREMSNFIEHKVIQYDDRSFFLNILNSHENSLKEKRIEVWKLIPELVENSILSVEDIRDFKEDLFSLLIEELWQIGDSILTFLVDSGIIDSTDLKKIKNRIFQSIKNNSKFREVYPIVYPIVTGCIPIEHDDVSLFLEILHNSTIEIKFQMFYLLPVLLKNMILSMEDIRNMKDVLFELLESFHVGIIPASIWSTFSNLFYNQTIKLDEVIKPEEIKKVRNIISNRLTYTYGYLEYANWIHTLDLIKNNNLLTLEDITKDITILKDRILYRLKSYNKQKLLFSWLIVHEAVENNVITPEDVKKMKNGLFKLIIDKDDNIKSLILSICPILPSFFALGILDFTDMKIIKKWLFTLLESSDKLAKTIAWSIVPQL